MQLIVHVEVMVSWVCEGNPAKESFLNNEVWKRRLEQGKTRVLHSRWTLQRCNSPVGKGSGVTVLSLWTVEAERVIKLQWSRDR